MRSASRRDLMRRAADLRPSASKPVPPPPGPPAPRPVDRLPADGPATQRGDRLARLQRARLDQTPRSLQIVLPPLGRTQGLGRAVDPQMQQAELAIVQLTRQAHPLLAPLSFGDLP